MKTFNSVFVSKKTITCRSSFIFGFNGKSIYQFDSSVKLWRRLDKFSIASRLDSLGAHYGNTTLLMDCYSVNDLIHELLSLCYETESFI